MKLSIALLSAAVAVSAAQQHQHAHHQHLHKEKRNPVAHPEADYATVPGPVKVLYVLNGVPISEDEVQEGIRNGTLVFSQGELANAAPPAYAPAPSPSPPPSSPPPSSPPPSSPPPSSPPPSSPPPPAPLAPPKTTAQAPSPSPPPPSAPSPPIYGGGSSGVDAEFPDGQLSCDTFPSDYGAVPVEWVGLGGWTGIQCPGSGGSGSGYDNIRTVTSGGKCEEDAYCSYACPAGYQKSQWPTTQGATGQSIGGIQCRNGKLHLTNPGMSNKLCMKGSDKVQILVKNTLNKNVAVCRTDYPGTESETVPLDVQPGQTLNLTCPEADNYYTWQGGKTSAQYYVNPAGVPVEDACQWGSPANPWGNYAPLNLGVGYSNGAAWLSVFQNAPTTDAKLDFCVEIVGDGISGSCKYQNGQYCSGTSCSPTTGCTVSVFELWHGDLRLLLIVKQWSTQQLGHSRSPTRTTTGNYLGTCFVHRFHLRPRRVHEVFNEMHNASSHACTPQMQGFVSSDCRFGAERLHCSSSTF